MTLRESRGMLILVITLVTLISGGILAYKNPGSWNGQNSHLLTLEHQ